MNSTTVVNELELIAGEEGNRRDVDVAELAKRLGIDMPALVSILTEAEDGDKIMINLSNVDGVYAGTVRLMDKPSG